MSVVKKTIGINPLEEYLSYTQAQSIEESQSFTLEQEESVKKQRLTIHIPEELVDRVKNAVFWEPGLTLAAFAEEALYIAIEKLEQERGAPFPNRKSRQLKGGRPMK